MKKLLCLSLLLIPFLTSAQIKKEISPKIYMTFPAEAEHTSLASQEIYEGNSENCIFQVEILKSAFPSTSPDLAKVFLDNFTKEILRRNNYLADALGIDYTKKANIKSVKESTEFEEFPGRTFENKSKNSLTGKKLKTFHKVVIIRDRLIVIKCWILKKRKKAGISEKDNFFSSINIE